MTLVSIEPGKVVMELQAGPQHANPMGTLHGGVLCDVADAAMGMAYAANLAAGETFTTLELKINFLKPVWQGKLRATGHRGEAGPDGGPGRVRRRRRGRRPGGARRLDLHDPAGRGGARPLMSADVR
jgi:uncharacterized protein (TIGR00369 family)